MSVTMTTDTGGQFTHRARSSRPGGRLIRVSICGALAIGSLVACAPIADLNPDVCAGTTDFAEGRSVVQGVTSDGCEIIRVASDVDLSTVKLAGYPRSIARAPGVTTVTISGAEDFLVARELCTQAQAEDHGTKLSIIGVTDEFGALLFVTDKSGDCVTSDPAFEVLATPEGAAAAAAAHSTPSVGSIVLSIGASVIFVAGFAAAVWLLRTRRPV